MCYTLSMTQNADEAPWFPGSELRVLVDSEEHPDVDYLPCIWMPGSTVYEIPNTEWVTYVGKVYVNGTDVLHKFMYNKDEVYISSSLFQYLIHQPRKAAFRINRFTRSKRR